MNEQKIIISPKTKVLAVIEAYPQLEDLLIEKVPVFEKIKNPLLRKTIAKTATLQQAALIGGLSVEDLINFLRKAVGQTEETMMENVAYNLNQPTWFDKSKIVKSFDVRQMLAAGEHPVNQVMADLKLIKDAEIYELIAPFLTAPLIDKASSMGVDHWVKKEHEALFYIYFKQK